MDRSQFTTLVEGGQKAFRCFLTALCCGDSNLADDLAQESYIKAYLSSDGLEDPTKFKSWLYRIGYNSFLNHRRTTRPMVDPEILESESAPDSSDSKFRYQALYMALDCLPEKERTAILLYYMEDYDANEIADIIKVSNDAVRQYLSRGRMHLRNMLTLKQ